MRARTPLQAGDGVPKYMQVARILRDRIVRQEYRAGDRIPTEAELGQAYRVSRITVRQAIDGLAREGYLERRQGLGTFVQPGKLRRDIARIYSFSADMERMGLTPSSRILALTVEDADEEAAAALGLPADARRVCRVERVRLANGAPILRELTLVPESLCPGLVENDLAKGSLYRVLADRYHLHPHHAEDSYEAIVLEPGDAALLECPARAAQPAFAIRRLTFLEKGTPIELTRSVGRGDRMALVISMSSERAAVERRIEL